METILQRLKSPTWAKAFPALDQATRLDIADVRDLSRGENDLRLTCNLRLGVDAETFADRLRNRSRGMIEVAVDLKTPLAEQLRSWVQTRQGEDLSAGLDELEMALGRDWRPGDPRI